MEEFKEKEKCIHLFPYDYTDEFIKRWVYAQRCEDEDDFDFDDWEDGVFSYWFMTVDGMWALQESLEEAIIELFDVLDMPYDDWDVQLLYGLENE
jgi:hypothetical protein